LKNANKKSGYSYINEDREFAGEVVEGFGFEEEEEEDVDEIGRAHV
jgi:hypothetical protein